MRKISALFILFLLFSLSAKSQIKADWLVSYIDKQRTEWNVPGLAFGLVQNDSLVFAHGSGTLKEGGKEKVDANTQFGIASNTKAFTAAAVALLVEEGKLRWEDKVIQHLPWFELYDPYVTREFTIKDLLTHHSGLATFSGDAMWYASTLSRTDIIKRAKYLKPVTGFRSEFGYSNIMYLTAGEIVAKISGVSYDEFIQERFFTPLGMKSTNSSISKNPKTNVALPHAQVDNKNIAIPYVNWDNMAAAGAINSNITDLSKWVRMWLNNGTFNNKVILKPASINQVWNVVTPQPVSPGIKGPRGNILMSGYGCGWNVMIYRGVRVVNHSGGLDGMISHTVLLPEKNAGFIILCNAGVGLPGAMIYDIIDHILGHEPQNYCGQTLGRINEYRKYEAFEVAKQDQERKKDKKPSLSTTDYAGKYSGNVYGAVTVTVDKKGIMSMQFEHTPTFNAVLEHWEGNKFVFYFKEHPSLPRGWVTFTLDDTGKKVTEMKVDLPNPDFDFTEIDLLRQ